MDQDSPFVKLPESLLGKHQMYQDLSLTTIVQNPLKYWV